MVCGSSIRVSELIAKLKSAAATTNYKPQTTNNRCGSSIRVSELIAKLKSAAATTNNKPQTTNHKIYS
jgi:hypothetical protein